MTPLDRAENFADIITMIRHARRHGTGQFSYRQLADKLGYRSPRTLAMVHKGQRPPSRTLVQKIVEQLKLRPHETELVTLLAEKAVAEKKKTCTQLLDEAIERRRRLARRLLEMQTSNVDDPLTAVIFVSELQKSELRKQLEVFFVEITTKHAEQTSNDATVVKYIFTVSAQSVRES